jgi:hypothetical protein
MDARIRWLCLILLFFGSMAYARTATTEAAKISPDCQYYPVAVHFLEPIRTTLDSLCQSAPLSDLADLSLTFRMMPLPMGDLFARSLPPPHPLVDLMSFQR